MIKKLRVTVDGATYDVTVELPDEVGAAAPVAAPATTPTPPLPPITPASQPRAASTPTAAAPGTASPAGDVPSPLAGRVTAIVIKPGQLVKQGDHLLTLEAMKMNTFVFAPQSGTVAEIKVAVGDAVEESQPLIRIQ